MKFNLFNKKNSILAVIFLFSFNVFSQENTAGLYKNEGFRTSSESFAAEEFRRGVQSFYRGSYNDSILCFEKALSYLPEDNLILTWLGKAYFRSGLETNALESWNHARQNGYGGLLLENTIQIVKERRISNSYFDNSVKFTESGNYSGDFNDNFIFSNPCSIVSEKNGSFWVLAYGSNELLHIDVNGTVLSRSKGPINGFDRPLDLIKLSSGEFLVTEVLGNRLSVLDENGKFIKQIGKKGRGIGEVVGPQYAAEDFRGNIFVSDYGNKRISVFDKDGNGIFAFGNVQNDFKGLKAPTGIAIIDERLFVCDEFYGSIFEFDLSGNYKGELLKEKTLNKPEALKFWNENLIVCDSNKVYSIEIETGSVFENIKSGNAPSKLTCAVPDVNGNILVSDFKTNEIYVMSKMEDVVSGFFVQIERVNADKFPQVVVDIKVENSRKKNVVGLNDLNFYITEEKRPVSNLRYLGSSYNNSICDITILIDRNILNQQYEEQINSCVREIASSMKNQGTLRIVSASNIPLQEYVGESSGAEKFSAVGLKSKYSKVVPLDLALRLSANDLINAEKKRAIIFVTSGKITHNAFEKYSLNETASYLSNNSISFSAVSVSKNSLDESLEYLVNYTNGKKYYLYRTEGISSIVDDIKDLPSSIYSFSYESALNTNFGEKFLPVEAEVYLMNKSGRDETGYFAPLQ